MSDIPTLRTLAAARAITSVHETGHARPDYACLATLHDGPGGALQVTFGAHQATDRADSLDAILVRFKDLAVQTYGTGWEGRTLADELAVYIPRLAANTAASTAGLARDKTFLGLLKAAAAEPLMRAAQEDVFARLYMAPSIAACSCSGFIEPLTLALVYDTHIHGAYDATAKRTPHLPEREWAEEFAKIRRANLANAGGKGSFFRNPILRNTTYRMDTFLRLIAGNNWSLAAPIAAHGRLITEEDIAA